MNELLKKYITTARQKSFWKVISFLAEEAHLVIFDRYEKKSWEEKIYRREQLYKGRVIAVWGM